MTATDTMTWPRPTDVDRAIIAARLKGYLNKPEEAIALLTDALGEHPDDVRLLRFRGHRRISIRDYAGSRADFRTASGLLDTIEDGYELYQKELEEDIVNLLRDRDDQVRVQHLPVSQADAYPDRHLYRTSLHTAVWYYFGVATFLDGDIAGCLHPFEQAEQTSLDAEGVVPALDWQCMALWRLGRTDDVAAVLERFEQLPEGSGASEPGYRNRMLLYTGRMTPERLRAEISDDRIAMATQGFGLGNWYLANGQPEPAYEVFADVLATGAKYAFGYLAAEAELRGAGRLD